MWACCMLSGLSIRVDQRGPTSTINRSHSIVKTLNMGCVAGPETALGVPQANGLLAPLPITLSTSLKPHKGKRLPYTGKLCFETTVVRYCTVSYFIDTPYCKLDSEYIRKVYSTSRPVSGCPAKAKPPKKTKLMQHSQRLEAT